MFNILETIKKNKTSEQTCSVPLLTGTRKFPSDGGASVRTFFLSGGTDSVSLSFLRLEKS